MNAEYSLNVTFPSNKYGTTRARLWHEFQLKMRDSNINFSVNASKEIITDTDDLGLYYVNSLRISFHSEADYMLFYLKFGTSEFCNAIIDEVHHQARVDESREQLMDKLTQHFHNGFQKKAQ